MTRRLGHRGFIIAVGLTVFALFVVMNTDYSVWQTGKFRQPPPESSLPITKSSSKDDFSLDPEKKRSLKIRFTDRKRKLEQACTKNFSLHYRPRKSFDGRSTFLALNFTICTLEKVGSQFWRRFLTVYKEEKPEIESVGTATLPSHVYMGTIKVVFVRDPYSRMVSGYVDKFFSANLYYWKILGKRVIQKIRYRGQKEVSDTKCGKDVTFSEFVEYVLLLHNKHIMIDSHFLPVHYRCQFCDMGYDYIGKMETFMDDLMFVSDAIGALGNMRTQDFILTDGINSANEMYRNAWFVFNQRSYITDCGVTLLEALKLTWRGWQIRGFIETKFQFPFKRNVNVTLKRFHKSALVAHAASEKRKLADSKMAALREAYSTLSLGTKLKLKELFLPQFEMFGYDAMPEKVFGKYDISKNGFSYFEKKTIIYSDE